MSQLENLERQVEALGPTELAEFRAWFLEFDRQPWDQQLERDVRAGKLDAMAAEALRQHADGRTSPLCRC